jgi:hypothetical protein
MERRISSGKIIRRPRSWPRYSMPRNQFSVTIVPSAGESSGSGNYCNADGTIEKIAEARGIAGIR